MSKSCLNCKLCGNFDIKCHTCGLDYKHWEPTSLMLEHYCPAGKINCDNHRLETSQLYPSYCTALSSFNNLFEFETCPFPSKQKPIKDKYEQAFKYYRDKTIGNQANLMKNFIEACKKADLK